MRSLADRSGERSSTNDPERGATAVEFAIVAALVLAIVFGILEYGLIFLQEHYVADAAREGARIGVRANNYDCYRGTMIPGAAACTSDRAVKVRDAVREYLDILYDADDVTVTVRSTDVDETHKLLRVSVQTPNFCPPVTTGLLRLLHSDSNASGPAQIAFTTTMEYEDHEEFVADP